MWWVIQKCGDEKGYSIGPWAEKSQAERWKRQAVVQPDQELVIVEGGMFPDLPHKAISADGGGSGQ